MEVQLQHDVYRSVKILKDTISHKKASVLELTSIKDNYFSVRKKKTDFPNNIGKIKLNYLINVFQISPDATVLNSEFSYILVVPFDSEDNAGIVYVWIGERCDPEEARITEEIANDMYDVSQSQIIT